MAKRSMRGIKNRKILQREIAKIRFYRLIPFAREIHRSGPANDGEGRDWRMTGDQTDSSSYGPKRHERAPFHARIRFSRDRGRKGAFCVPDSIA